jgi:hypothetical protein
MPQNISVSLWNVGRTPSKGAVKVFLNKSSYIVAIWPLLCGCDVKSNKTKQNLCTVQNTNGFIILKAHYASETDKLYVHWKGKDEFLCPHRVGAYSVALVRPSVRPSIGMSVRSTE